jgi:uncharacterized protein (DUF736 family)
MVNLPDLVTWMDSTLRTSEVADYSGAVNGLQVEAVINFVPNDNHVARIRRRTFTSIQFV